MNPRLFTFFLGVAITAVLSFASFDGVHSNTLHEAMLHRSGYYTFRCDKDKPAVAIFHWADGTVAR